jgi:DNA-binding beta-propeller fold protein YncE
MQLRGGVQMKKLPCALFLICAGMLASVGSASASVIGVTFNGTVASFDSTTGTRTVLGNAGITRFDSLAKSLSGTLYSVGGASDDTLVTIDPATGIATAVATLNYSGTAKPSNTITGLSFSPTGDLLAVAFDSPTISTNLYRINPATGETTLVGSTGKQDIFGDIAFSPSGTLYAWSTASGLMTINTTTGLATDIGNSGILINDLAFRSDGTLWAARSTSPPLWSSIDLGTGALTSTEFAFAASGGIRGIQFLAPVPVPATVWLFGSALAGFGFIGRRQRNSAARRTFSSL